jgi:serine/threonine protein kinase
MTCPTYNTGCPLQISKSALSTLESIHRAGILHGDIRRENILIGDSGVTIIDFGHSKQCHDQGAKDEELVCLRHLLGLAHKNH